MDIVVLVGAVDSVDGIPTPVPVELHRSGLAHRLGLLRRSPWGWDCAGLVVISCIEIFIRTHCQYVASVAQGPPYLASRICMFSAKIRVFLVGCPQGDPLIHSFDPLIHRLWADAGSCLRLCGEPTSPPMSPIRWRPPPHRGRARCHPGICPDLPRVAQGELRAGLVDDTRRSKTHPAAHPAR